MVNQRKLHKDVLSLVARSTSKPTEIYSAAGLLKNFAIGGMFTPLNHVCCLLILSCR